MPIQAHPSSPAAEKLGHSAATQASEGADHLWPPLQQQNDPQVCEFLVKVLHVTHESLPLIWSPSASACATSAGVSSLGMQLWALSVRLASAALASAFDAALTADSAAATSPFLPASAAPAAADLAMLLSSWYRVLGLFQCVRQSSTDFTVNLF